MKGLKRDYLWFVGYEWKGYVILFWLVMSRWPLHVYTTQREFLFKTFSERLSSA